MHCWLGFVNQLTVLAQNTSAAYESGRRFGQIFAIVFVVAVVWAVIKKFRGD